MTEYLQDIPALGCGLSYRRGLHDKIFAAADCIEVLEIVTDQFLHRGQRELAEIVDRFPVIPHGVGMSIGTSGGLDREYLRLVKRVSDITAAPYYSEHLAITTVPGINIGLLSPVWYTEESLRIATRNLLHAQDYLEKPIIVENISYDFEVPHATMSEAEFFCRLVDEAGCGLLLDLTNVYINSVNHQFDATDFLNSMPLHAVTQIHLAGGHWESGRLVDSHSRPVHEEAWRLLEVLTQCVPIRVGILERDANLPDELTTLLDDVIKMRHIIAAASGHRVLPE